MTQQDTPSVPGRMPTGVAGFDEIADHGLPRGGVTVVLGGVGAGKTVFGMQVLASGAMAGEPGLLIAFEESAQRILANTNGLSWGGDAMVSAGVHILDAQLSQAVEQAGDFDLVGLLAMVGAKAKAIGAQRLVFDGVDVLLGYLGQTALIRREIFRLRDWVHESGMSAIVTAKGDAAEGRPARDFDFLQFMADCVVQLSHRVVQGTALRSVRVAKYRGAAHSANELPMTISRTGIEVAANTQIELAYPASTERVSTGVERLDVMLSGGYYRGSSVLITGAPGTAKSSLAAAFAVAAARRGERTVYVSFDEAPEQIVRNVASIGIELAPHVAAGTLRLHALRARAASPEGHIARIRAMLRDHAPRHLVIDPLSALGQHGSEVDAEGAALQILDLAKSAGITIVSTSLLGNSLPSSEQTPLNVSTIADTWMHLSYVSKAGERNRALTIIKARGIGHSNQVRELVLSDTGVTLADVYAVDGEVLMGTQRWEKENDARRARATAHDEAALRQKKVELAIAETRSHIERLALERALQETELEQIKASAAAELDHRTAEGNELLQRRRADSDTADTADTPGTPATPERGGRPP